MQTGPDTLVDKEELSNTCAHLFGLVLTRGTPHTGSNGKVYYLQADGFGSNQVCVRREGSKATLEIKDKQLIIRYQRDANSKSAGYLWAEIEVPHEGPVRVLDKEGPWQDHLKQMHTKIKQLVQDLPSYILTIETANDAKFARARELYNV